MYVILQPCFANKHIGDFYMAKENIIIWQKWVDPFGGDDLEQYLLSSIADQINDPDFEEELDEELEEYNNIIEEEYEEEYEEDNIREKVMKTPIRVMATPMGIIPMTENTASGKIFNFWVGHTNFDITKKIADMIEKTDGVETFDVFTRYRFRVGVGKAFSDSETMREINSKVYETLNNA